MAGRLGSGRTMDQRHRSDDKNIFLRGRVKRGVGRGVRKEGQRGTHLEILLSA